MVAVVEVDVVGCVLLVMIHVDNDANAVVVVVEVIHQSIISCKSISQILYDLLCRIVNQYFIFVDLLLILSF